jgi:hypothetical protein
VSVSTLDILDQPVQLLVETAIIDRQPMTESGVQSRAHREHQRVVSELLSSLGVDDRPRRVEPLEAALDELDADVARDLLERCAAL